MRIIKNTRQHHPYPKKQDLSTLFSKNGCCLFILILLFQFFPSFFFMQGESLVWALRFQTSPQAIDDVDEDNIFSPNGDSIQDTLLISFVTDGDFGDFRIIIDTHGPSGVGPPDGHFRVDEDWIITGEVGPGIDGIDAPTAIREAWNGNDFSRQQEEKNPHLLKDGRYQIRIEIDAIPNEQINHAESGYAAVYLSAIIDNTPPQLSATVSQRDLSPNGDSIIDEIQIAYGLSEDLTELELEFTNPSDRPAVSLTRLTEGNHSFIWTGDDGLGTTLSDGPYTAQLYGSDKGGNMVTFGLGTFQIDTEPPTLSQLTPNRNSFRNTPIGQIEAIFAIGDGSLIDVDSIFTEIVLENATGAQINGVLTHDEDTSRMTLTLDQPLDSSDENGTYTISVSAADKAGNIVRDSASFTFDNVAPTLTSITTDAGELTSNASTTTKFTFVDVTLADNIDSTVNFSASTIRLNNLEGTTVAGNQRQLGENGIRWTPGFSLATDGSDDGSYTITVQSQDRSGNAVEIQISFIYDTQAPELVSLTSQTGIHLNPSPSQLTLNRNSFRNTPIGQIEAIFAIGDGSLIDVDSIFTEIVLKNATGAQINGVLTHDEDTSRMTLTLDQPLDSSDENGTYTISVSAADKAGNIVRDSASLTFDNVAPTLTSITTDAGELTSNASTTTKFTFVDVTLTDNIDSTVNFSASTIRLSNLEGTTVAGNQRQLGENGIRWTPGFSLATDGSDDGSYTITVQSQDRSGNAVEIQISFIYDTQAPELVSLTSQTGIRLNPSVGAKTFLNSSLSAVIASFGDENGGGIDFSKTTIEMVRLARVGGAQVPVQGILTSDTDNNTLEFRLTQPLEHHNGSQDGIYRIRVKLTDKASNSHTENFELAYDTQVPAIVSTTPAENETVSSLSQVWVVLNAASGVDFSATGVRLLRAEGTEVNAEVRNNGRDTVFLTLTESLAIDGSEDGEYTIEITPVDGANNARAILRRQFFVASRIPEIRLNAPTENRINNLTTIDVQLFDYIGPGLAFSKSKSTVTVSRNGAVVEAKPVTVDETNARLVWTIDGVLSRDGSADGEYIVNVQYTDLIGKAFTENFILTFDSQPPAIIVDSRPQAANPLTTERIEVELEVTDNFEGVQGSGFDATTSTFELFDANNARINGAQTDDGISRFTFRSEVLPEGGMYVLVVTLVDRAGNHSIPQRFIYDAEEPTIQAVSHIELTATVSNVSEFLTRVEATVSDVGTGIDFNRSLIQLLNAMDEAVPGAPYHDDEATIGWELKTPLTREGNFDGLYSLRVIAIDKAGYVEEKTFVLRYDTQAPIIHTPLVTQSDGTPIELSGVETPLITSPINQITVGFSDGEGSGMDVLRTTVSLIGPEGTPVGANQTDNGTDTVFLSFNPLRADGSDDGFYRVQVTPTDLAGNTLTSPVEFQFFYGTRKPEVISTTPAEFAAVTQLTEVSATLQDHSGEGINFDHTTIFLKAPDQSVVPGHQTVEEAQSLITWELNQPLSRDGSMDGEYIIQLSFADKVGNSTASDYTFVYDTFIPTIISVTANTDPPTVIPSNRLTAIENSFDGLTIKLSDANSAITSVSGIDLVGTSVQLLGPGNTPLGINTRDDGVDTIIASFTSLYQPGTYTLEITPQDLAGNVSSHTSAYEFNLELGRSTVAAVTINDQRAPVEFVKRLEEIVATLEDVSGTGLNLTADGSTITVIGPQGEVEGIQTSPRGNQIVWRPLQLVTDGSADGIYIVTVTPVNSGGRLGIPSRYQFTLDTQEPEVASITPIDLTQPLSYIGRQFIQIAAQVEDMGPAGLEVEDQRLQLRDAAGNVVPAVQTNDGDTQIFLTLSQPLTADGSDDGIYSVSIELMDKAGNLNSFLHQLVYDTFIPTIISVTANTDPPTVIPSNRLTAIENSFDGLTIKLSDVNGETTPVSGMDLVGTSIQLLGPGNTPLSINTRDDGVDTIIASFTSLYQPGTYTLEIMPQDLAGNISSHTNAYEFNLELGRSTVAAVTINGQRAPVEFVKRLEEIVATLEDVSGTGLNLTADGSTIVVNGPNGAIEGVQASLGANQIAWRPLQLATDGSADGIYTVTVTPVNSGGRLGIPSRYQFTLDTQEPEVASITPIDLTQPLSYIGRQFIQIAAQVEDMGPAGLEVEDQRLQLRDAAGNVVPTVQTNDGDTQIFLTLSQPLTTDGSDDGIYSVSIELADKAGNLNSFLHQLVYDTFIPTIISVTANTDPPTVIPSNRLTAIENSFDGLTIKLSDVNGETTPVSGMDLVGTSVQLLGPENTPLGINTRDDGVDTIIASFTSLYQPGTYTLEITPQDLAGNVSSHTNAYEFNLELGRSTVAAVTINGQMAPVEFVKRLEEIVATLEDVSGTGLNLTADGSTIVVNGPNGAIEGVQASLGANQIAWRPLQLATDGSTDGVYIVTVTPVNSGGRLGIPSRYQFTLDTQEPEVASITPIDLTQPLSYIGRQFIQIAAQVEDMGPAGLEVEDQRLQLRDAAGNVVPAVQTNDGDTQIFLTLSQPLTADGSDDGIYSVSIELMDKAGNLNSFLHQLVYDTFIPTIISVTANTNPPTIIPSNRLTAIENSFDGLTIKLSDVNGETTPVSGMDLVGTSVQLLGPENTPLGINTRDDGVDTIIASFTSLYQPGTYTLEITPQDLAGNVSSHTNAYEFNLELGRSTVAAVTINGQMAPVEFVKRLEEIVATLEDVSGTGLNLTADGSTIVVNGPNGAIEGVQASLGANQIAWRPLQLATDGSTDGVYIVTVTPVNSGDRLGIPSRYQFTLDTQEPEVASVTPIDLTQPLSYIGQQFIQIAAQVEDMGPAGLEVEDQRLQLRDAAGNVVPAVQTNDGDTQIFLTLSQPLTADGSDDGIYSVSIELADKAGNLNSFLHKLVYDTQAPTLVSTDPTDGDLRGDDITLITANLNDPGDSGVDFATSALTLLDPIGTPISGVQSNDGYRKLTLQINGLVADGNYTIRVEAIDRSGNGLNAPFETQFTFSSGMPVVVSTVPKTTPVEEAFTNESLHQVEVELQSDSGAANRSTIALLAPDGTTVPGQQVRQGKMLIYRLLRALATDGSDDGTYTILVIPVNNAGRQGVPEQFSFVYDTVAPEVDPTTIQLTVAEPGVNNSLVSVGALVTDDEPSSGVDWDNLDLSWITLEAVKGNRKIDGTLTTDEKQVLLLNLIMPLASDGSQDGIYQLTIAPKDHAGNVTQAVKYRFFYDTRPPMIDASSLFIDGQPLLIDLNDPYYPSATSKTGSIIIDAQFSDVNPDGSPGLGADLVNSSITVRSPAGNVIGGITTQNGTDSIRFKSGPLDEQGLYQVTITSVGLDAANLGFQPTDSITTQFLFETTKPVIELTDVVGETTFEDEPLPLQGTAHDPSENDIPASEIALIEVVGTGPDGQPIDPVVAKDDSEEEEDPWSRWSIDFLPSQSGEYNLDIRVTDRAGNIGVYDAVTVNFSVSLIFKGPTYVWPNPLSLSRRSNGEVAHFSFEVNVPGGEGARIALSIYDFAGDLVYEKQFDDLAAGRNDNEVMWNLTNQSGVDVARGIYIFRLEAEDMVTSNRTNAVGKIVVVE